MARWAPKLFSTLVLAAICLALFVPVDSVYAVGGNPQGSVPVPGGGSTDSEGLLTKITNGITTLPLKIVEFVLTVVVLPFVGLLLNVVGVVFDFALNYSLESRNFITGASGEMISFGWTLVRDICNMVFIFALIYASMQVIFGQGDAKKSITNIIIAALLVNFSLFFTKVMIDVSNIFALTFKAAIDTVVVNDATGIASISDFIRFKLGTDGMLMSVSDIATESTRLAGLLLRIMLIILITYSLFQVAIIFLSRIVTMIFLMIFSPLGFVGLFIPKMKGFADDWWKSLNEVVMVTPVFLFTFYIILKLLGSKAFAQGITPIKDSPFSIEQFFGFFIIVFLMQKAVKTAKSMAGEFGTLALKAGNAAAGLALGAGVGGAAILGRATIGRAALSLTKNEAVKGVLRNSAAGRLAFKGLDNVAGSSFDVRNSKAAKSTVGALGVDLDISGGIKVGKGGVKERDEAAAKDNAKFYGKIGLADDSAYDAAQKARDAAKEAHDEVESVIKDEIEGLKINLESSDPTIREAAEKRNVELKEARDAAKVNLAKASSDFSKAEKEFIEQQKAFVEKLATPNIVSEKYNAVAGYVGGAVGKAVGMTGAVIGPAVTEAPVIGSILKSLKTDPNQKADAQALGKAFGDAIASSLKVQETEMISNLRKTAKETASKKNKKAKDKRASELLKDVVSDKNDK